MKKSPAKKPVAKPAAKKTGGKSSKSGKSPAMKGAFGKMMKSTGLDKGNI